MNSDGVDIMERLGIYTKGAGHIRMKLYTITFARVSIGCDDHATSERWCCCA